MRKPQTSNARLLICVENRGYRASLEKRKIYVSLTDPEAAKHGQVRVIDESGEDYLYPRSFFLPVTLPHSVRKAILAAA
ncbi:MAG: hypothetical protein E6K63_14060 [Nitrospirae bacterium]|nr:MAG: hypothetical protein E6K63_14060 [Nitrospirota bacterium]